jgi:hypothetical protein
MWKSGLDFSLYNCGKIMFLSHIVSGTQLQEL